MKRKLLLSSAIAAALVASAGAYHAQIPSFVAPANAADAATAASARLGLPDFTELVSRTSPAVVSVRVSHLQPTGWRAVPRGMDPHDPFFEFFRRFGPPNGLEGQPAPIERGEGSGFIIGKDGYILTNAHVVANADDVQVLLHDKRELTAKVVGLDEASDVAVIKVDAGDLPFLTIGDPDKLKVGEWVIAIGSPFGFDHTVSAGVVSAKTRSLPNGGFVPFIQTDVAINPGNSGGPLLNLAGEVIGINSQIYSNSGGYMGLSFAIPVDVAMNIERQLVKYGKVTRGRLGVVVQSINQELAQSFGLPGPRGALVSEVQPGSAADRAGLQSGDVILQLNGRAIEDSAELSRLIADMKPGDKARIELVRNRETRTVDVAVGEADTPQVASAEAGADADTGRLGVVVRALGDEDRHALEEDHGVLVEQAGGPAARAGIRSGDVILAVNASPVSNPEDLQRLIGAAPAQVALLIKRDNAEIYVPVKLG